MLDDNTGAPGPDQTRQGATVADHDYSLTIEDVANLYSAAGLPRTPRTIQRYCAKEHLDARKVTTTMGDKYLVAAYSVARHIAQIHEVVAFTASIARADQSRHDATKPDQTRQVTTGHDQDGKEEQPPKVESADTRYVDQLERENTFLRQQVSVKDGQIGELTERAKETNILIQGLQNLFLALQPGRPEPRREQASAAKSDG